MRRHRTFDTSHRRRSTHDHTPTVGVWSPHSPTPSGPEMAAQNSFDFLRVVVDIGLITMMELVKSSLGNTTESHRSGGLTQAPTTVVGGEVDGALLTPQEGSMHVTTESTENDQTQPSPTYLAAGSHIFQPTYNGGAHPHTMVDRMSKFATTTSTRSARCARGIVMRSSLSTPVIHRGRVGRLEIANTASGPAEGRHPSKSEKDPLISVGLLSANSGAVIIGSFLQNSEGGHEDFPLVLHLQTQS